MCVVQLYRLYLSQISIQFYSRVDSIDNIECFQLLNTNKRCTVLSLLSALALIKVPTHVFPPIIITNCPLEISYFVCLHATEYSQKYKVPSWNRVILGL